MVKLIPVLVFTLIYLTTIVLAQRRPSPPNYGVVLPETRTDIRNLTLTRTTGQPSIDSDLSGLTNDEKRQISRDRVNNNPAQVSNLSTKAPSKRRTSPRYDTDVGRRGSSTGSGTIIFPGPEYIPGQPSYERPTRKQFKKKNKNKNKIKGRHDISFWPSDELQQR